jgi:hypothetical protein
VDADVKTQWVSALRAGGYVQGQGFLRAEDSGVTRYSALGLLCELARLNNSEIIIRRGIAGTVTYDFHDTTLPDSVMAWAGFNTDDPDVAGVTISFLNDNGMTFEQIANEIEGASI